MPARGDHKSITVDGKKLDARYLGKGHYATAYQVESTVYLYVKQGQCNGKEILSMCQGSVHIPTVTRHEETCSRGQWFDVWSMPFYATLTAQSGPAWQHYRTLKAAAAKLFYPKYCREKPLALWGLYYWQDITDATRGQIPATLTDALQELQDYASNYGCGMAVEFAPRNLGTDAQGNLILRDIIFDAEKLWKERLQHVRRDWSRSGLFA